MLGPPQFPQASREKMRRSIFTNTLNQAINYACRLSDYFCGVCAPSKIVSQGYSYRETLNSETNLERSSYSFPIPAQ